MPRSTREYIFPPFLALALMLSCLCSPCDAAAPENSARIVKKTDRLNINMNYPVLNLEPVDKDIAQWAEGVASAVQDILEKDQEISSAVSGHPYELRADYETFYPSANALSVVFDVATYTGGAHDNRDIIVLSYDLNSGAALGLEEIFKDPESALNLMSSFSYKALAEELGDQRIEDMLKGGTTPDADNFSSIALTKDGICVYFQPYQVAPWSFGVRKVQIPLEELQDASPIMQLWGK